MKGKRILILNYEFPPLGGGGGVAAHALAKGFIKNGYEVDYVTSWYPELAPQEVIDGITIYRVRVLGRRNLQTASMISLVSFPFAALLQGIRLCRTHKYDFINSHFVVPTGPLGYVLSKLFSIKHILSLHGGDIYDPTKKSSPHRSLFLRAIIRFLLNRADRVVAQSTNTRENTIKYYHRGDAIDIIPLAYEPFAFSPASRADLRLENDKKYIIGVGRLVERKRFDVFIRTLALLDPQTEGIIIGEGPARAALAALAKDLGIEQRVHLVGQVSAVKKFQYLSQASVFVLSSAHEGFGIVLQEAMQVGLPIVATNYGGQTDMVSDGINGYLVSVADVTTTALRINDVLTNRELRATMSTNNMLQLEQYRPEAIADAYSALLT